MQRRSAFPRGNLERLREDIRSASLKETVSITPIRLLLLLRFLLLFVAILLALFLLPSLVLQTHVNIDIGQSATHKTQTLRTIPHKTSRTRVRWVS